MQSGKSEKRKTLWTKKNYLKKSLVMLGILAAVKTSLSPPQLLYRYPPIARSKLTTETLKSRSQILGEKPTDSCEVLK